MKRSGFGNLKVTGSAVEHWVVPCPHRWRACRYGVDCKAILLDAHESG